MAADLIRHIGGENIGRFPVWMMRQAGRYLPEYRRLRERYSFWESVKEPQLAAEITLQPLKILPLDAAILFSDILTLPEAMGIRIDIVESVGPVVEKPLYESGAFEVFERYDPLQHTPYVSKALNLISKELSPQTALIGFAGGPWTVASYLIEGKGSKNFSKIKTWMYKDPSDLQRSLSRLSRATTRYLLDQANSGAQIVQLFDTWASEMPSAFFNSYYKPILIELFEELGSGGLPVIYFAKGASHLWEGMRDLPVSGVGIDSLQPLTKAQHELGTRFFLQGNLDPMILQGGDEPLVRKKTRELVKDAMVLSKPAVLNLGHGILPGTPVENVRAFLEEARTLWV